MFLSWLMVYKELYIMCQFLWISDGVFLTVSWTYSREKVIIIMILRERICKKWRISVRYPRTAISNLSRYLVCKNNRGYWKYILVLRGPDNKHAHIGRKTKFTYHEIEGLENLFKMFCLHKFSFKNFCPTVYWNLFLPTKSRPLYQGLQDKI